MIIIVQNLQNKHKKRIKNFKHCQEAINSKINILNKKPRQICTDNMLSVLKEKDRQIG